MFYAFLDETPVGRLLVVGSDSGLKHIAFSKAHFSATELQPREDWELSPMRLQEPLKQLRAYFSGKLKNFDLPLKADGTDFQKKVWHALLQVPFGKTASYGEIAASIGSPAASRAVGMANGKNPVAIVVPCHRIIGGNGKLVGYGGGLDYKRALLRLEGVLA